MNSGVSSNMWIKPCNSRRTSFGIWREVRVSPCRKIGIFSLRQRISITKARRWAMVFSDLDKAVQLAQNVVRNTAGGAALVTQEDRNILVAAADFHHKGAQMGDGFFSFSGAELLIVNRQNERQIGRASCRERR